MLVDNLLIFLKDTRSLTLIENVGAVPNVGLQLLVSKSLNERVYRLDGEEQGLEVLE